MPKDDHSLDDVYEAISELGQIMSDGFSSVDKRFEQVDKRFEQVDKRFEQVDKRFEQVDKRFEQVDKRFENLESEITELKHLHTTHTYQIRDILDALHEMQGKQDALYEDIKEIYIIVQRIEDNHTVTKAELIATQRRLEAIISWAQKVSDDIGISLKLPQK